MLRIAKNVLPAPVKAGRRGVASAFVERALDRDGSGRIEAEEADDVRLVVYGQSFGGDAVVEFARMLEEMGVPIRLTVQIDSVGVGDATIPANVEYAANLFQDDGWFVEGEHPIRAEVPERTTILENREFDYDRPPGSEVELDGVPWWDRLFRVAHARMDLDPRVWSHVEHLVIKKCSEK